jgi:hypothetical protein
MGIRMKEKFNLSDKIEIMRLDKSGFTRIVYFNAEDVKEFIRRLKERIEDNAEYSGDYATLAIGDVLLTIDRLAGDKLK